MREAPPATLGLQVSSDVSTHNHVHRQSPGYEDVHPNILSSKNGGKNRTRLNIDRQGGSLQSDLSVPHSFAEVLYLIPERNI